MNKVIGGKALAVMLSLPVLMGYVGQLVSTANVTAKPIEGPYLGDRVGKYVNYTDDPMSNSWHLVQGIWNPCRDELQSASVLYGEHGNCSSTLKYYLNLYKCPENVKCEGQTECISELAIVFHAVRTSLVKTLSGESENYPVIKTETTGKKGKGIRFARMVSRNQIKLEAIPEEKENLEPPDLPEIPEDPEKPSVKNELPEERIEDEDNRDPEDDDEDPIVPLDFTPTDEQLRDIKIAHDNAGHPNNQDFVRLLRRGNARPEVAQWVRKHFKCPECEAHQRPKARRPAAVLKTY